MNLHPRNVKIVGVPMDLGQQRRGVDMGPSAVRYAGLFDCLVRLGHDVHDTGNIRVPERDEDTVRAERWVESGGGGLRHLTAVTTACQAIYDSRRKACTEDDFPIFLGGDHSMAIGTISGMAALGSGRRDLDRRARRLQHTRFDAFRQHSRYADGGAHRARSSRPGQSWSCRGQAARPGHRHDRASAISIPGAHRFVA